MRLEELMMDKYRLTHTYDISAHILIRIYCYSIPRLMWQQGINQPWAVSPQPQDFYHMKNLTLNDGEDK